MWVCLGMCVHTHVCMLVCNFDVCYIRVFVEFASITAFIFIRLDRYCLARILFTLLLSPPLIFLYYSMLYVYMFEGHDNLSTVISRSIDLATDGLTELYLSSHVLGSWVYVTLLTCLWPLWLAIWSINFQ